MLFDEEEIDQFCKDLKEDTLSEEQKVTMIIELAGRLEWGVVLSEPEDEDEVVTGLIIGTREYIESLGKEGLFQSDFDHESEY